MCIAFIFLDSFKYINMFEQLVKSSCGFKCTNIDSVLHLMSLMNDDLYALSKFSMPIVHCVDKVELPV